MATLKRKIWSACKIVLTVLLYATLLLALLLVVISIGTKKDSDGAATLFGYQFRIVQSDSMAKCDQTDVSDYEIKDLPVKTLLIIQTVPQDKDAANEWYADIEKGDVLTFRYKYTQQVTITHRVENIRYVAEKDGYEIQLIGDNKATENQELLSQTIYTWEENSYNYVIGKVTGASFPLGWLIYAMRSPVGIICLVLIPSLSIIVIEIVRIVNVLGEDKKKKAKAEAQKKEEEIEELKRRLAMLENGVNTSQNTPADASEADAE